MSDSDTASTEAPTRRDYVKYGGAIVGGGLLAGCAGGGAETTTTETTTGTETTADDGPYEVCILDRYCTAFESVPETWAAATPAELDMGVILGEESGLVGMFYPSFPTAYYDRLSRSDALSLSVDTDVVSLLRVQNGNAVVDKEFFYEADADVFLLDPNTLTRYSSSWSDDDTEEVAGEVGPFVGHHGYHDPGSMGYDHLPLYDYFRVVADVFRKRDRFEAFAALHDEVRSRIRGRIDGLDRPRVAVVASGSDPAKGTFWPVGIRTGAWGSKQFRDLDVRDAWDGVVPGDGSAGAVGYEALAEADPDVVVYQNHLASRAGFELRGSEEWRANYVEPLAGHGAGSAVTAVEEGNVYPTALHVQGPLLNLQAMEFTAKQLFPDEFDADEELFDRERLASVCDGDI